MKAWWKFGALSLLLIIAVAFWLRWREGWPRRLAIQTLSQLDTALHSGNAPDLLKVICTPAAIQGRTAPEQAEFLTKALADEISPEGLAVLQREGAFGPLTNLFPVEAERWAGQAGVKPGECVAFKLERRGLCAEVVLARPSTLSPQPATAFRIVRCNNVKQLAQTQISDTNSHQ